MRIFGQNNYKFSLIIGSFNPDLDWLSRAIKSAQELFDEIILVDDGSKDPIPDYPGVMKIRHAENLGFYRAKNTGITAAKGDVIAILDDDDMFDRTGVRSLKKRIQKSNADIWHFHLQKFNEEDGIYGEDADPKNLVKKNSIPGVSWFKKIVWEKMGGFTEPTAEDWDLWYRAWKAGFKFEYFPEIVYYFNKRSDSVSAKWTEAKFLEIKAKIIK